MECRWGIERSANVLDPYVRKFSEILHPPVSRFKALKNSSIFYRY
jgi:hypothetical protein